MTDTADGPSTATRGDTALLLRSAGRTSEALAERLDAMIRAGDLRDGARLPSERALMQLFGVSRTVVREAIGHLANRGLLATRPGYRPVIRKPDYETALGAMAHVVEHLLNEPGGVRNLFESRILVEAALVRHAASHARREDIESLRDALERNALAIGDPEAFYATDIDFHAILFRIPGNPIYPALHKAYVAWLMSHWEKMERVADMDRLIHKGHAAIFDAIVARDPDQAESALRRHLEFAWELVSDTFAPSRTDPA